MSRPTEAASPTPPTIDVYGRDTHHADGRHRKLDPSGRITTDDLTDREIAEETLATLRQIADVISQIGANPAGMMSRFMPGMGPVLAAVNQNKKG